MVNSQLARGCGAVVLAGSIRRICGHMNWGVYCRREVTGIDPGIRPAVLVWHAWRAGRPGVSPAQLPGRAVVAASPAKRSIAATSGRGAVGVRARPCHLKVTGRVAYSTKCTGFLATLKPTRPIALLELRRTRDAGRKSVRSDLFAPALTMKR